MWHENTEEIEVMFSCWCSCCKCNWHCNFMQLTQLVKTCLCPRHPCCYHHRPPGNAWVHLPHWRGLLGQVPFHLLAILMIFLRKLALNILNVDEEHLDYYEWERFAKLSFLDLIFCLVSVGMLLIGVFVHRILPGNINCSATSSLTTAWSEQAGRKERWSSTSLFAIWSTPSTNSAESGINWSSSFKGSLWSHLIKISNVRVVSTTFYETANFETNF